MSNDVISRKILLQKLFRKGKKRSLKKGRISNKSDLRWCNSYYGKISKWQFDRNSDRRHRISCQNGDKGVVWLAWQKFTCWSINTLWFHVIFSVNAKCHWNQLSTVLFWFRFKIFKFCQEILRQKLTWNVDFTKIWLLIVKDLALKWLFRG